MAPALELALELPEEPAVPEIDAAASSDVRSDEDDPTLDESCPVIVEEQFDEGAGAEPDEGAGEEADDEVVCRPADKSDEEHSPTVTEVVDASLPEEGSATEEAEDWGEEGSKENTAASNEVQEEAFVEPSQDVAENLQESRVELQETDVSSPDKLMTSEQKSCELEDSEPAVSDPSIPGLQVSEYEEPRATNEQTVSMADDHRGNAEELDSTNDPTNAPTNDPVDDPANDPTVQPSPGWIGIDALNAMLGVNSTSYKFYWLWGILDEVYAGNDTMSFDLIVARMVARAWYPVVVYGLSLGTSDRLPQAVDYVQEHLGLPSDAGVDEIAEAIERALPVDKTLASMIAQKEKFVPYRLIAPFYRDVPEMQKANDARRNGTIFRANRANSGAALYAINEGKNALTVSAAWADYLRNNKEDAERALKNRLVSYLQSKNPGLKDIDLMIERDSAEFDDQPLLPLQEPLQELVTDETADSQLEPAAAPEVEVAVEPEATAVPEAELTPEADVVPEPEAQPESESLPEAELPADQRPETSALTEDASSSDAAPKSEVEQEYNELLQPFQHGDEEPEATPEEPALSVAADQEPHPSNPTRREAPRIGATRLAPIAPKSATHARAKERPFERPHPEDHPSRSAVEAHLSYYQDRAATALDALSDHIEEALVSEVFAPLGNDVTDIATCVRNYMRTFQTSPRTPIRRLVTAYPDALVVYAADAARRLYQGRGMWGLVLDDMGFDREDQNTENLLKQNVVALIEGRGFTTYSASETTRYYHYTLLLHAGFTQWQWEHLWADSVLPAADRFISGKDAVLRGGASFVKEVISPESPFCVKHVGTRKELEKAPLSLLTPLLDSALDVARQVKLGGDIGMVLHASNLTTEAMRALQTVLDREGTRAKRESAGKTENFLSLEKPSVLLDVSDMSRPVVFTWPEQAVGEALEDCRVDVTINDETLLQQDVVWGFDGPTLPEMTVNLAPASEYKILLVVQHYDEHWEQTHDMEEVARQSFQVVPSRTGTYEFVRSGREEEATYRLSNGKFSARAETAYFAYLVERSMSVVPSYGMELQAKYELTDEEHHRIYVFAVHRGASARVTGADGTTLDVLQGSYNIKVQNEGRIGRTSAGRDVYGFAVNAKAETVFVGFKLVLDTLGGESPDEQITVRCECDGKSVARDVRCEAISTGEGADSYHLEAAPVAFSMPPFVGDGVMYVLLRSTGEVIKSYRFSVIPVLTPQLVSVKKKHDQLVACYRMFACAEVGVRDPGEDPYVAAPDDPYYFERPLSSAGTSFGFAVDGMYVDSSVRLAGISFEPNRAVQSLMDVGTADLGDVMGYRWDDHIIRISTDGERRERWLKLTLGQSDLLRAQRVVEKETFTANVVEVLGNAFKDPTVYKTYDGKPKCVELTLRVAYGSAPGNPKKTHTWCGVTLGRIIGGFGTAGYELDLRPRETFIVARQGHEYDLYYRFYDKGRNRILGETTCLPTGQRYIAVRQGAKEALWRDSAIVLQLTSAPRLRKPDFTISETILFELGVYRHDDRNA